MVTEAPVAGSPYDKVMKKAEDAFPRPKAKERRNYTRLAYLSIEFAILFAFWLILSGHYQIKYIAMGAFAAGLVTFLTSDLVYPATRLDKGRAVAASVMFLNWRNFSGSAVLQCIIGSKKAKSPLKRLARLTLLWTRQLGTSLAKM